MTSPDEHRNGGHGGADPYSPPQGQPYGPPQGQPYGPPEDQQYGPPQGQPSRPDGAPYATPGGPSGAPTTWQAPGGPVNGTDPFAAPVPHATASPYSPATSAPHGAPPPGVTVPGGSPYGPGPSYGAGAPYGPGSPYGAGAPYGPGSPYGSAAPWDVKRMSGTKMAIIVAAAVAVLALGALGVIALVNGLGGAFDDLPGIGAGADTYGDDANLDALWDSCEAGDGQACDDLYWQSPVGSEYEEYGDTCGHRFAEREVWCADEL